MRHNRAALVLTTMLLIAPAIAHAQGPSGPVPSPPVVAFQWASTGDPSDPMQYPGGVTVAPDGRIWVADTGHSRFAIIRPDGTFDGYWGTSGAEPGEFVLHRSNGDGFANLAFAPDGSFFVLDAGSRRIEHFAADRTFLNAWGGFGGTPGKFGDPLWIATEADGSVLVVDDVRNVVERFAADATVLSTFEASPPSTGTADSIAVGPDGDIYVSTCCPGSTIQRLHADGSPAGVIGGTGPADGQFLDQAGGMAVDGAGNLFVGEGPNGGHDRIQVFGPDGSFVTRFGGPGDAPGDVGFPFGIALDGHGGFYAADYLTGTVKKYDVATPNGPGGGAATSPAASFDPVILDGTWRTSVTAADEARAGLQGDPCVADGNSGTLVLTIDHGRYVYGETCDGVPFSIGDSGTIRLTLDTFTHLPEGGPSAADFDWSLNGNVLDLRYRDSTGDPIDVPHEHLGWEHTWTRQP